MQASNRTNALIHEKSPYLRQHAHNPVDWLAWGKTAFDKARNEDKPIFLSIGYSTCHWCHVMAHESFEDERVAEVLNRDFVPIKIDREERPDIDRIYMLYVQASTGTGGWPMSVWLTPDLKPFFGGTYFPPDSRYGRPGFRDLLVHLSQVWKNERDKVELSGKSIAEQLQAMSATAPVAQEPERELLHAAFRQFERAFDKRQGGFGGAPKFPRPVVLNFLIRYSFQENNPEALAMVTHTLQSMAAGGMHDHLGGGFHRYSVDQNWFVPHFEKMLYDQAQLAIAYLEAYQATGDRKLAAVARDVLDYVLRDLTSDEGGFYSAEDADSPDPENPTHSGEGSFYIWRKSEIDSVLGPEASPAFCKYFGVEASGNVEVDPQGEFRGRNILFQAESGDAPPSVNDSAAKLLAVRSKRPRPHLDNKVLTAWNGLQISSFAKAYRVLGDARYLEAAHRALKFVLAKMYEPISGQLLRRYCDGDAAVNAFLDDYAFLSQALLDLFEAKPEGWLLKFAIDLAQRGMARFEDEQGGFFSTEAGASDVLLRIKDDYDGAEPSGNSVATDLLFRLAHATGQTAFSDQATRSLRAFTPKMKVQPTIAPQMLVALGRWLDKPEQVIIRCEHFDEESEKLEREYTRKFSAVAVVLRISDKCAEELREVAPFLSGLDRRGRITVYECRDFTCQLPKVIE